jgi:peptidyl-prolyl cis-trans isomerase B (cyclophilin B)
MKRLIVLFAIVGLVFAVGCKGATQAGTEIKDANAATKNIREADVAKKANPVEPTKANVDVNKKYTAVIKTSKGDIVCELFVKDAPLSVTNFKMLADEGFYDGLTFHRVEPGFVIQGGDPTATGAGGPGYTIPAEINGHKHIQGALAWARQGDEVNPERRSSGSQFYITLAPTPFLDGKYTVFGQTVKGQDVADKIRPGDTIEKVEIKVE